MDDHRGHDTVSAAAERAEKQNQLEENQRKYQQKIQTRKKELEEQRNAVASYKSSAQAALEDTERMFTELICCIERKRSEISELIRAQEKAAVRGAEGVLERLEQEIAEMRRRNTELEQLLLTEDHLHFLQSFKSLSAPPGHADFPSITAHPVHSFEKVVKSVSQLRDKVGKLCEEEIRKTSLNEIQITKPQTREKFLHRKSDSHLWAASQIFNQASLFRNSSLHVKEIRMIEPQSRENFLQYSYKVVTARALITAPAFDPSDSAPSLAVFEIFEPVTLSNLQDVDTSTVDII
ncbi:hypothetical protein SRHO_G00104400 [Serrasalmus rhombeus]